MIEFDYNAGAASLCCRLSGRMAGAESPQVEAAITTKLAELTAAGAPAVELTLDLAAVEYVSSAFLRVVIACAKAPAARSFAVTNCAPLVRRIFAETGLDRSLTVS